MMKTDENLKSILSTLNPRAGILNDLVAAVQVVQMLEPFPACATCPASFWYLTDDLSCFCKVKKNQTWGARAEPVRACSERETLLMLSDDRDVQRAGAFIKFGKLD